MLSGTLSVRWLTALSSLKAAMVSLDKDNSLLELSLSDGCLLFDKSSRHKPLIGLCLVTLSLLDHLKWSEGLRSLGMGPMNSLVRKLAPSFSMNAELEMQALHSKQTVSYIIKLPMVGAY